MKVFYRQSDKKTFTLTDARLRMYQRLLRLNHENSAGLSHIFRVFKMEEPIAEQHRHLIMPLVEVNILRPVTPHPLKPNMIALNTDEKDFFDFVIKLEHRNDGLFGVKISNISLRTDLLSGIKQPNLKVTDLETIYAETVAKPKDTCTIL